MATVHDPLSYIAGDTWTIEGTLLDDGGMPLTTISEITWALDTVDGRKNLLTLSLGTGITVSDPAKAEIWIEITPEQSALIPPGHFYDWLQVKLSSGKVFTEWTGIIMVTAQPPKNEQP